MRRQTFICLKSLGVYSSLLFAGCGANQSSALSGPDAIPAPRQIELPVNIQPLITSEPAEDQKSQRHEADGRPVPAQYQQPPASATSQPRITGLSSPSSSSAPGGTVRESYWGNPRAAASSSATMPRGDFLPMGAPQQGNARPIATPPSPTSNLPAQQGSAPPVSGTYVAPPPVISAAPPMDRGLDLGSPKNNGYAPVAVQPPTRQQTAFVPAVEPSNQFVVMPSPPAGPVQKPVAIPSQPSAAMQAVAEQAMQMANQAGAMAQRGMLYSAKTELVKGLTLISQALDVQQGTAIHALALSAGLTALEEARDFASAGSQTGGTTDIAAIAGTHQTKLPAVIAPGTSPVVAQQQYFGFAQQQLAIAGGGIQASSEILYRLGRLQTAMAAHDSNPAALHGPQAIVFYQAALTTDGNNWKAANELGVLYARYGQLPQSRQLLVQSVTIHPNRQGWQNLAVVHRRLGEIDLAQRAEAEVQLLDKQPGQATASNDMVRWVDAKTFAASSSDDGKWPASVAAKTVAAGATRR